jgi:DNA polymerase III delta prime subunit
LGRSVAEDRAQSLILLTGPIGVGKTTLGRALAARLGCRFLDADDFGREGRPWFHASLSNCRRLLGAASTAWEATRIVEVAKPLRCREWAFFRAHLAKESIRMICIGLTGDLACIADPRRGRPFSGPELSRMQVMFREGYGERPFCDHVERTDAKSFEHTLESLVGTSRKLLSAS